MPPKFQSSFIPKGAAPTVAAGVIPQTSYAGRQHDLVGFIAKIIFALSILGALGVVGYRWYLGYSIGQMSAELEAARQEVASGVTGELIRLNDRIVSAQTLLDHHRVLSPIFTFLQDSTPKTVRFSDFSFLTGSDGPQLVLKGEAKSYAALSFEASIIYKNKSFRNPVFSDIRLDEQGNVTFVLKSSLSPDLLSYEMTVGRTTPLFVATSTQATSTLRVATSTATSTKATVSTSSPQAATSTKH